MFEVESLCRVEGKGFRVVQVVQGRKGDSAIA